MLAAQAENSKQRSSLVLIILLVLPRSVQIASTWMGLDPLLPQLQKDATFL
jgi:hypothetical protein